MPDAAEPSFDLFHVLAIGIDHADDEDKDENNGEYDAAGCEHGAKLILKCVRKGLKIGEKFPEFAFHQLMILFKVVNGQVHVGVKIGSSAQSL